MRAILLAAGALLAVGLVALVPLIVYALGSPFTSVAVPRTCTSDEMPEPGARKVTVTGLGEATMIAADGPTAVVVVPAADGGTARGTAHVLVGDAVVVSMPVASRAVAAGVADGIVYLFDDKIGYLLDAATGASLPRLFTVDNYRGLFTAGSAEFVQTSIDIAAVGLHGQPFMARSLPFGTVVDGCPLAAAVRD